MFEGLMADSPYERSMVSREVQRSGSESVTISWISPNGDQFSGMLPFSVYPPREDTDLLARSIANWPRDISLSVLEIGCGSGVLACFASALGHHVTACDINPFAVASARNLAERHGLKMNIYEGGPGPQTDQHPHQWGGNETYDRIIWNLPYLPSDIAGLQKLGPLEEISMLAEENFSLYQLMLEKIKKTALLSKEGIAYFVVSSHFELKDCLESAWKRGLAARIIETIDFEDETIACVSVWHPFAQKGEWNEFDSVSSTNELALSSGSEVGSVWIAQHQTKGRGRGQNTWASLEHSTAASWVVMMGDHHPSPLIQLHAGFNLLRLFRSLNPSSEFRLKYPNDIFVKHVDSTWKKCCGLLIESTSMGQSNRVVLGVGINLFSEHSTYGGIFYHSNFEYSVQMLHGCLGSILVPSEPMNYSIEKEVLSMIEKELVLSSSHLFEIYADGYKVEMIGITDTGDLRIAQGGKQLVKHLSEVSLILLE